MGFQVDAATGRRAVLAGTVAGMVLAAGGCSSADGWLWDPSKVGRWERTPTTTPVLRRIASIEGTDEGYIEQTEVQPEDLIPEAFEYRIGPGDVIDVVIWNLPHEGARSDYRRTVDTRGMVSFPQLGEIAVEGRTIEDAKEAIADAMRTADLGANPIIDVSLASQRELRFNIIGAVYQPGPYQIPAADFRLLEALTAAGGPAEEVIPATGYVFVIRQIPLEDRVTGDNPRAPAPAARPGTPSGENLVDIINELSKPPAPPPQPEPEEPPAQPPSGSPGVMKAPIALINQQPDQPAQPAVQPLPGNADSPWVFLNGQWVQAHPSGRPADRQPDQPERLVTQRVIRVPIQPLMNGDARYNIVIRPGDVVRVPRQSVGVVFIGGEVARAGTYGLSDQLTLTAAIIAAGGLGPVAIPERLELTRHIGHDRIATIQLNLRAIYERTHPDIYLKANDQINIGTNFWATPLAIVRNGFRATYGFGFLLDRNFGADVFGAEPVDSPF